MHTPKMRSSLALAAAALLALLAAPTAYAQVSYYSVFKNAVYQQTGSNIALSGYYFGGQITVNDPNNDASAATITPPGGAAEDATLVGNTFYDTTQILTKAQLDASYPNGTYTFAISGGDGVYTPDSGTLTVSGDMYTSTIPAFTPGTVAALASYDPAGDFTFNFNSFTPDTPAGATYFVITDANTGMTVPNTFTVLASTNDTSLTLPGGTLMPNHAYQVQVDFSNRFDQPVNGFSLSPGAQPIIAFDTHTLLNFTTAPEPSSWAGLAFGALGLAGLALRARRRAAQG